MGKMKTTKKALNEGFECISASYCGLENLLTYESPMFYTCGVYGWNCDGYILDFNGRKICLTTGYRGMINNCKNNNSYKLYREYDGRAQKIRMNYDIDYKDQKVQITDLLNEYLTEVFK